MRRHLRRHLRRRTLVGAALLAVVATVGPVGPVGALSSAWASSYADAPSAHRDHGEQPHEKHAKTTKTTKTTKTEPRKREHAEAAQRRRDVPVATSPTPTPPPSTPPPTAAPALLGPTVPSRPAPSPLRVLSGQTLGALSYADARPIPRRTPAAVAQARAFPITWPPHERREWPTVAAASVRSAVDHPTVPVLVVALIGLFLLVQSRLDRNDPKLARDEDVYPADLRFGPVVRRADGADGADGDGAVRDEEPVR